MDTLKRTTVLVLKGQESFQKSFFVFVKGNIINIMCFNLSLIGFKKMPAI